MIGTDDNFVSTDPNFINQLMQKYKDVVMYIREDMIEKLREGKCRVIFTKLNGEQRDMHCTLNTDLIPLERRPKNGSTEYSAEMIRAFDIDKQEFRTFKVENVISFSPY